MANETDPSKVPVWFKIISIVFLIWNIFGLVVFCLMMFVWNTKDALLKAGLNDEQAELTLSTPGWVNVAFAVAVIFGVLGSIALLMKRKIALPLFLISLVGVLAQNSYTYLLSEVIEVMGPGASPLVILGAIAIIPFTISCGKKGWLR